MGISEELYTLLAKQDWEDIIVKLTAYATWLRLLTPVEQEPEDIAMGAITKVYDGQRRWDPAMEPDLLRYLRSVVKSMISNDLTSSGSNRRAQNVEIEDHAQPYHDHVDEELYSQQVNERILHDMRGDPELCLVYKALKDQYTPKEITEEYGLPISSVQSAQKRLRRIAARIISSFEKAAHGTEKL